MSRPSIASHPVRTVLCRCRFSRKPASVTSTECSSRGSLGAEVGQTEAVQRLAQLQAVKEASTAAPPDRRHHGPPRQSPALPSPSRHRWACPWSDCECQSVLQYDARAARITNRRSAKKPFKASLRDLLAKEPLIKFRTAKGAKIAVW